MIEVLDSNFGAVVNGVRRATLAGNTQDNPNLSAPVAVNGCDGAAGGEAYFVFHLNSFLLGSNSTATVTIDTEGTSGFNIPTGSGTLNDTVLYVRTECMDTRASSQVGCDDDGATSPALGSRLVLSNLAKGSYVIVVDGFSIANQGPLVLNIAVDPGVVGP
jgi:hypothetical protein